MPNELTPARRGAPCDVHARSVVLTKNGLRSKSICRIRAVEVEARRKPPVLEREHRLDQPGDARRRVEMADVRLDRAERAEAGRWRPKGLGERRDLDRIAERGAGAVGFDVADLVGPDAGQGERRRDDLGLSLDARRRVADLGGAVVVDRGALDDRVDVVAVGERILEPLQEDDADAAAEHRAARARVERAAVAVGREDAALLVTTGPARWGTRSRRRRQAPCRTRR